MKLFGICNDKIVVASIAHYDYNEADNLAADGGQLGTIQSAGYNRFIGTGRQIWFEVPETFAELYNDYRENNLSLRKYGVWKLDEVKILSPEEIPDTESFAWQAENAIWGTNGLEGNLPTTYVHLKDCDRDHLMNIAYLCQERGNIQLKKIVEYWLDKANIEA